MNLSRELLKLLNNKTELLNALENLHPHISETYINCCQTIFQIETCLERTSYEIETVLSYLHDHLNTGDWNEVSSDKRTAFTAASFVQAVIMLNSTNDSQKALKCIDRGFLLGLPLKENPNLLTEAAALLSHSVESDIIEIPKKRLKTDTNYNSLEAIEVEKLSTPTLEEFYKNYFMKQTVVVIKDCMSHWPACKKWLDVNYLIKIAGERTVPIEIGSSYSDENFAQKLMTFKDFVTSYYINGDKEIGYLAQHDLLNQIPELRNDIRIPDYCVTSRNFNDDENSFEPEINAWFGPEGTISTLHQDPKDNLLCQVYGVKQILLFKPTDGEYLYVHENKLLSNTARVDPVEPDLSLYPNFTKAIMLKCLLRPGEMLYIPPKWWHHVTALEKSFSVNFWWK